MSDTPENLLPTDPQTPSVFSLNVTYVCNVCKEEILRIEGDTLTYLKSHISESNDGERTTITINAYHSERTFAASAGGHSVTVNAYHPGR